jgi:hypothetical protein
MAQEEILIYCIHIFDEKCRIVYTAEMNRYESMFYIQEISSQRHTIYGSMMMSSPYYKSKNLLSFDVGN